MPKLPRSTSSATSSMASGTIPSRPAKPHPDRLKIMHLSPDRPLGAPRGTEIKKGLVMPEALFAAGLSFWSDVTFGMLLAVALVVTAELLARYAAEHATRRSQALQSPAPSGADMSSVQLFSHS